MFDRRFAEARKEVDTGSCELGERLFFRIAAEVEELGQPELADLLARATFNRGVALINLRKDDDAIPCFEKALSLAPGGEKTALAGLFLARCKKDRPAMLAEVARLRGAAVVDPKILTLYEAEALYLEGNHTAVLAALEKEDTVAAVSMRIYALCGLRRFPQARSLAEKALQKWPKSLQVRTAGAFALAKPIVEQTQTERAFRRTPSIEDREILERALRLYAQSESEAAESGNFHILNEVLSWTSLVWISLGEWEKSLEPICRARARWPDDTDLLSNEHYVLLNLGRYEDSERTAVALGRLPGLGTEGVLRQVASQLASGKLTDSEVLMDELLRTRPSLKYTDTRAASHLLHIAQLKGNDDALASLAEEYLSNQYTPTRVLTTIAEAAQARSLIELSDRALAAAEAKAEGEDSRFVKAAAGQILFDRGDWAGAIRKLGEDGVDPLQTNSANEILWCLFKLEDFGGTIELAKRLDSAGIINRNGRRAWARSLVEVSNEPEAERQMTRIVMAGGASAHDYTNLFMIRRGVRPFEECLSVLEQGREAYPSDPIFRSALSKAYVVVGKFQKSVTEARELSRLAPDSEIERELWASVALSRLPTNLLTDSERQRVSELVTNTKGAKRIELSHEHGSVRSEELEALAAQRAKDGEEYLEIADTHRLCGSIAARLVGLSVWEYWWQMSHSGSGVVAMAQGDPLEQIRERETCAGASEIVADYSILCTLAHLGQLRLLHQLFRRVVVVGSTRTVFLQELETLNALRPSRMTAVYREGRLAFIPVDESWSERKRRLLADVIDFLDHSVIAEGSPSLDEVKQNRQLLYGETAPDRGTAAAILTAKSLGIVFASDEELIRRTVCMPLKVGAFSSQAIVSRALDRGILSKEEYLGLLETMIVSNYWFVSVPITFLRDHLKNTSYRWSAVSEKLLRKLGTTIYPGGQPPSELGSIAALLWRHRNDSDAWRKNA